MNRLFPQCCASVKHILPLVFRGKERNILIPVPCKYFSQGSNGLFHGEKDRFRGVTVDLVKENCPLDQFDAKLEGSLEKWRSEGKRCIWFKVDIEVASLVPILAQKGFNFHHARHGLVTMYKWLPKDSEPNLPPPCFTNLGVGAMVFNKENKLLAISETAYEYPHWKLPGGYVERGEDIVEAAIREVKEETGVDCAFESLVTFRHTHNMMFGNSDIYILIRMSAITEKIIMAEREIKACKWMDVEEYTNHPDVHAFNKLILLKALEYKKNNIKLNYIKKRINWASYVRDMHYLVVEGMQ